MCRHIDTSLGCNRVLAPPQTGHGLRLRVKVQSRFAVKCARSSSSNALLVACEREHREWYRNRDVDPYLPSLDVLLKVRGGRAAACEDGDAVAVFVGVDHVDGIIDSLDIETDKDWTEDFFGVAFHMWFDVGDDRWTDLQILSDPVTEY